MCERDGVFTCATCEKEYKTWALTADFSTPERIKEAKVICPKSSQSEPVVITFNTLKAHLQRCSCNEVANEAAGPSTLSYATMLSRRPSAKQQSAAHSADKKEGTIGVKVRSTRCHDGMPRQRAVDHNEGCSPKHQHGPPHLITPCGEYPFFIMIVASYPAASIFTAEHTGSFESHFFPRRKEHPVSSTDSSELTRQLQEALSKISHLENEVEELKKEANEQKGEMSMLQAAVPTIQEGMRNECHGSLQQAFSVIREETNARLDAVEESMKDMNEKVSIAAHGLQEQSRHLHAATQLVFAQLEEIRNNFYHVLNFIAEGQGSQGHRRSK
ncbi:uncharacterized protein [Dermacentor albipictus]